MSSANIDSFNNLGNLYQYKTLQTTSSTPGTPIPPSRLPQTGATVAIGTSIFGGIAIASGLALAKKKKK